MSGLTGPSQGVEKGLPEKVRGLTFPLYVFQRKSETDEVE